MSTKRRIFNLGQKVWKAFQFESSRGVIIALAHWSCKTTAENFDRHVTDVVAVKIIFDKNSYHRSLKLVVAALASVRAGCVELIAGQFQSRDTKYLSVGFIFRISEVKDSSRLRFGSKYSTPSWILRKYRIVGVSWRWFPRRRRPKIDRGKN